MTKYDSGLYLKLNNFGFTEKSIAEVKNFLLDGDLHDSLDTTQKKTRYKKIWSSDKWKVESNDLIYKPLNLTVVPDDERAEVLKKIYEDITQGPGQGISLLYKRVRNKYLNVRRSDVSLFLKAQIPYQLTRPQQHKMNKPILAKSPSERWGIDCINMLAYASANGGVNTGWKYILTVVDYYSRRVFLRPLKAQKAVNVRDALISIVANDTKTYPRILQCDNGGEFKGETSDWMREHNISVIKTLSYSPESNGLVELKNKLIRNVLRECMIRTNSRNWVNHLQTCANLLNTQQNGTTKRNPNDIWKEGHELQGEQDKAVIQLHEKRIENSVKNNPTEEYKVGDYVRVKMGTLFSSVRKQIKSGDKKLIVVNFSPTVY